MTRPEHLPYQSSTPIPMRHYGRIISLMVNEVIHESDERKKKYLTCRLANKMKQQYLLWNKDHVERARIIEDIALLSDGQISCDFPEFRLLHGWQLLQGNAQPQQQQNNRRNRNRNRK